ncbi:hypothetical protein HHI36_023946 [Cryptolaemus montrouzieri]|uniref:Uncharacterized protein n=1 Tax=Cryptolaemus montrouzieri TaxID=559131 RepID=A0ABD2N1H6_9CUCU
MTLLGAQYTFRYRKYHIAFTEEQDSLTDPLASCATLISRRSSNSTLFSDILPLQYFEKKISSCHQKELNFAKKNKKESEKDSKSEVIAEENLIDDSSDDGISIPTSQIKNQSIIESLTENTCEQELTKKGDHGQSQKKMITTTRNSHQQRRLLASDMIT